MPGVCGKVVPPELPEEGVVLVLWPPRLVVVGVVATKHVEVGIVGHAAMAAPGWGAPVACRGRRKGSTETTVKNSTETTLKKNPTNYTDTISKKLHWYNLQKAPLIKPSKSS